MKGGVKNAATQAKKRWNKDNYKQVKVNTDPELASAFKKACAASGASMAAVLKQLMAEYCKTGIHAATPDYSTRRKRRAAVRSLVRQLEMIRCAEEQCRDNTPENLQESVVYETADEYVSRLEEAIELMGDIY